MNRREAVLGLLVLGTAGRSFPTFAQQQKKDWRIGFLQGGARPINGLPPASLIEGLVDFGYVVGKNLAFEARWADARFERLPSLAEELIQSRVDAIIVVGWQPANAIKRATSSIPIVIAGAGNAVDTGLASSLSRPGKNLTGMSESDAELSSKRLQLLKETFPKAKRMAVLWNLDDQGMTLRYRSIDSAAHKLGVTVQGLGVREPDDFEVAFSAMRRSRPDALFLVTDALTSLNRKRVIEFAAMHGIPAMYEAGTYVEDGGLMSYGSSLDDRLRRAAYYVDRIFKGDNPGQLPMELPTRYYLYINQKSAKELRLKIPQSILARADRVIE